MLSPDGYTDEQWLELMIEGLEKGHAGVPGGPPPDVQRRFVGWSGGAAMKECFPFFQLVKRVYRGDLSEDRVLDFGVGWGRLIRLFAHDVPEGHLFGVDVDPDVLQACADTGVPGSLGHIDPADPLPFGTGEFGLAYAYSVFSHLSEPAAAAAFDELARVLHPGGQLTFTTQGRRFLESCCAIRRKSKSEPLTEAERTMDSFFQDPFHALKRFRKGKHVYTGVGGGGVLTADFYGWAAIPEKWLRSNLPEFTIEDITDDPSVNEQVVVTLRRR
jgi:SAM-dependent methyltransferase